MSTKELAYDMIENLTEEQLNALIVILKGWEVENEIPNEETLEAIEEVKRMEAHPEQYKSYTDVDEMMRELLE